MNIDKDLKDILYILWNVGLVILFFTDYYWISIFFVIVILLYISLEKYKKHKRRRNKRLSRQQAREAGEYVAPIEGIQNHESSSDQSVEIQKGQLFNFCKFYFFYFFSNKDEFFSTTIDNKSIYYNRKGERLFSELFFVLLICTLIGVILFYVEDDLLLQKVWYGLDVLTCTIVYVFYIWRTKVEIS